MTHQQCRFDAPSCGVACAAQHQRAGLMVVDNIVAMQAVKRVTSTVPIVMARAADPVEA